MRYLGIETTEDTASIALALDGEVVGEDVFESRGVLCDELIPRILSLCGAPDTLDGIAVSGGPGSFTGLRIGVATAKALCHALRLPAAVVPTQHVYALCAARAAGDGFTGTVGVIQRARVGHCYAGLYAVDEGVREIAPARLATFSDAFEVVGDACLLIGNGIDVAGETEPRMLELPRVEPPGDTPRASAVLALAQWPETFDFELLAAVRPTYLQPSQAERTHGIEVE